MEKNNPLVYIIELARKFKLKEVLHYDTLMERFSSTEEIVETFYTEVKNSIRMKAEGGNAKYIS